VNAWLTPDGQPDVSPVCVNLPASPNWLAAFMGALMELADADNWEQAGDQTPDDVARVWLEIALNLYDLDGCNG
jgi:hypothetical protein